MKAGSCGPWRLVLHSYIFCIYYTNKCLELLLRYLKHFTVKVDPVEGLNEFKSLVQSSLASSSSSSSSSADGMMAAMGLPDIKGDLADMLYGAKDPPPGILLPTQCYHTSCTYMYS